MNAQAAFAELYEGPYADLAEEVVAAIGAVRLAPNADRIWAELAMEFAASAVRIGTEAEGPADVARAAKCGLFAIDQFLVEEPKKKLKKKKAAEAKQAWEACATVVEKPDPKAPLALLWAVSAVTYLGLVHRPKDGHSLDDLTGGLLRIGSHIDPATENHQLCREIALSAVLAAVHSPATAETDLTVKNLCEKQVQAVHALLTPARA